MKSGLPRLLLVLSVMALAFAIQADDFCMDCTERERVINGVERSDALCCMATADGTCFGGYVVFYENIGAQCQIQSRANGDTWCAQNTSIETGCEGSGGGGGGIGGGRGRNDDPNGCDGSLGACPAWCYSCM